MALTSSLWSAKGTMPSSLMLLASLTLALEATAATRVSSFSRSSSSLATSLALRWLAYVGPKALVHDSVLLQVCMTSH